MGDYNAKIRNRLEDNIFTKFGRERWNKRWKGKMVVPLSCVHSYVSMLRLYTGSLYY